MFTTTARRARRFVVALVVLAPLGSGVAQAQGETRQQRPPPITVTTLHGPDGESLEVPSPLDERPARALNERGQVVATIDANLAGQGQVVLWDRGVATRISPEGIVAHPTDISDRGQVVGDKANNGTQYPHPEWSRPFSWQDGEWRWLPVPDGAVGAARAVNNSGQVLGHLEVRSDQGTEVTVVAWSGDRVVEAPIDIGPGWVEVETVDINERGQALFNVSDGETGAAYLWQVGGGLTAIPDAEAIDVNNRGQVVGRIGPGGANRAFLWEDGEITDLGTLGGSMSRAVAINDRGQVVGISRTDAEDPLNLAAFLWEDGEMTDLGTLGTPGSSGTTALDINNRGQVVGISGVVPGTDPSESRAFVWQDGEMTDLGALLEEPPPGALHRSSGGIEINERGQVVGDVATLVDTYTFMEDVVLWELPRRR